MPDFIAALDQGTTSTRCMIFNHQGTIAAVSQKDHRQFYPRPGWVEHDPQEIWQNTQFVIRDSLDQAGLGAEDLAGLGITNQRETTVLWSKTTGEPICNAIVWQDTRTDKMCDLWAQKGGQDRFREKTGLPLSTYFSGPKIKWILDNIDGASEMARSGDLLFGTIDSWLVWNLTGGLDGGVHITDATNASRTLLMDLKTLTWDGEILDTLEIPPGLLPSIKPSADRYGKTTSPISGVPIVGILGDQQAALFGQGCFGIGEAKNTYGTGCFLLLNTGDQPMISESGLVTTVGYHLQGQKPVYALEGSIAIAGALVGWLRDNLGIIDRSAEIEPLAAEVEDNGGVYFVPAFSGLYAPYWRSDARGIIAGLTRYVQKAHIARAAIEATAYQTREVLEAMEKDAGVQLKVLKVDGGMVVNELLMQFQADVLEVPVIRPQITETTALGAAYAAGLTTGFWEDLDSLREKWQEDQRWTPDMVESHRRKLLQGWHKAVDRSLGWTAE